MNTPSVVEAVGEAPASLPAKASINLKINGANCDLQIEPRVSLLDALREYIEQPDALVDVTGLPFNQIEELSDGGISIGAAVENTAVANHRIIRERYPFLSQAILFGASGQIRISNLKILRSSATFEPVNIRRASFQIPHTTSRF